MSAENPIPQTEQLPPQRPPEDGLVLRGISRVVEGVQDWRRGRLERALGEATAHDEVIRKNAERHHQPRGFGGSSETQDGLALPTTPTEYASSHYRDLQSRRYRAKGIDRWNVAEVYGKKSPSSMPKPERADFDSVDAFRTALGLWKREQAYKPRSLEHSQPPTREGVYLGFRRRGALRRERARTEQREKLEDRRQVAIAGEGLLARRRQRKINKLRGKLDRLS